MLTTKNKERIFEIVIAVVMIFLMFVMIYPFWNALVIAFNEGTDTSRGGITFWPRIWTLENFKGVLLDSQFLTALIVTVTRVILGTISSIFITAMMAYAVSKKELKGHKFYLIFAIITMYFGGGLIPTYLVIQQLGIINTIWALFLPHTLSVYNMIVFRSFFLQLPDAVEEAAKIDGCNNWKTFLKIVLPLSKPILATLSLFHAVFLWNDWFYSGMYTDSLSLQTIQNYLLTVINSSNNAAIMAQLSGVSDTYTTTVTTKSLQMATLIVSILPIVCVYPFLQKYFVKGVLIGSVKE